MAPFRLLISICILPSVSVFFFFFMCIRFFLFVVVVVVFFVKVDVYLINSIVTFAQNKDFF